MEISKSILDKVNNGEVGLSSEYENGLKLTGRSALAKDFKNLDKEKRGCC